MPNMETVLINELTALEGIHKQNPDTGGNLNEGKTYLKFYTNRVFGAPFQLMDSVDMRIEKVNPNLGNQYLRNIMLNSPILHIKPGLPKYQGKEDKTGDLLKTVFMDAQEGAGGDMTMTKLMKDTIFSKGKQLQARMFGFRAQYRQYMNHVNYMCRSMAAFLTLTSGTAFPAGAVSNKSPTELEKFDKFDWKNYRMLTNVSGTPATEELKKNLDNFGGLTGSIAETLGTIIGGGLKTGVENISATIQSIAGMLGGGSSENSTDLASLLGDNTNSYFESVSESVGNLDAAKKKMLDGLLDDQVTAVMFMVEPGAFSEELTNEVADSQIEATLDGINQGLGQEIAFMTGSNVDMGVIDNMAEFLGNTATGVTDFVGGLVETVGGGGFVSNLFHGALNSLKGQKMIYPKIYKSSNSKMDYNFTVNLSTPYGDIYNYYMHIVVPLMHLIALVAPRMVSANSVSSPYIVQAFIPGMCTCQLGMVTQMSITKNPNGNRVSVHGFPLDVQVKFTITELYNAMSISPADDPASFLFNETLNDYMANLGGLIPSKDTYSKKMEVSFNALETYLGINRDEKTGAVSIDSDSEMIQDAAMNFLEGIYDATVPTAYSG